MITGAFQILRPNHEAKDMLPHLKTPLPLSSTLPQQLSSPRTHPPASENSPGKNSLEDGGEGHLDTEYKDREICWGSVKLVGHSAAVKLLRKTLIYDPSPSSETPPGSGKNAGNTQ